MKLYIMDVTKMPVEDMERQVSAGRLLKSRKYRFEIDRRRSLGAEILLNRAIAVQYGNISTPVELVCDSFMKPHLDLSRDGIQKVPEFNLSHSGNYAACVISERPSGVDIEQHSKKNLDYKKLIKRFFTEEENRKIDSMEMFYRYWTLKESYVKAVGTGIGCPFHTFEIQLENPGFFSFLQKDPDVLPDWCRERCYQGRVYEPLKGYTISVCGEQEEELPEEVYEL